MISIHYLYICIYIYLGVQTCAGQQRMTRAPLFKTGSPLQAVALGEWVRQQRQVIQDEVISKYSNHAVLTDITPIYDMEVGYFDVVVCQNIR